MYVVLIRDPVWLTLGTHTHSLQDQDDEGDWCTLASERDFREALVSGPTVRADGKAVLRLDVAGEEVGRKTSIDTPSYENLHFPLHRRLLGLGPTELTDPGRYPATLDPSP